MNAIADTSASTSTGGSRSGDHHNSKPRHLALHTPQSLNFSMSRDIFSPRLLTPPTPAPHQHSPIRDIPLVIAEARFSVDGASPGAKARARGRSPTRRPPTVEVEVEVEHIEHCDAQRDRDQAVRAPSPVCYFTQKHHKTPSMSRAQSQDTKVEPASQRPADLMLKRHKRNQEEEEEDEGEDSSDGATITGVPATPSSVHSGWTGFWSEPPTPAQLLHTPAVTVKPGKEDQRAMTEAALIREAYLVKIGLM